MVIYFLSLEDVLEIHIDQINGSIDYNERALEQLVRGVAEGKIKKDAITILLSKNLG